MSRQSVWPFALDFQAHKPVVVEASAVRLSSDAGFWPVRQFDERLGFTARLAAALKETRVPGLTTHSFLSMLRQRVYGLLADYKD